MTKEDVRIEEMRLKKAAWRLWGPYLSERQWGTVREDYSKDGKAWEYFPHDHARSRAYRWGEDGIAGISDDKQQLCFALALWNGQDPILKERLFGLTSTEGNHGEDVKEYYFYLDNLPSHAYMKYLYKYPQTAFPYDDLVKKNRQRTRLDPEYELLDTGVFNENRYFDIFVEYAKASPDDISIRVSIANRGPETATLHLLPTLWFRNTWGREQKSSKPQLFLDKKNLIKASHPSLGTYWLYCNEAQEILFTENETDNERIFNTKNDSPYVKDGFHKYVIHNVSEAINPKNIGTKAAAHYILNISPEKTATIQLRLNNTLSKCSDSIFSSRKKEADAFYENLSPFPLSEEMRSVQRQAFAGLLWNKQLYHYNVKKWLEGDPKEPLPPQERKDGRNHRWWNLDAYDIFSMPDKWEYPWFAAWDLAYHTVVLATIDPDFAKHQLLLLTKEWYMHPDGQIPAYEWSFSDVNPPVQAWAALRIYQIENNRYNRKDFDFLKKIFHKLSLNFTWWVNRKDTTNRNIFEGGFLGLDNISAINRDKLPLGATLNQVDGTAWMAMYSLNLFQIALELSTQDPSYEEMATKFFEHFIFIANAMNQGLWDEKNGFYYSFLTLQNKEQIKLDGDTLIGTIPLFAIALNQNVSPDFQKRLDWFFHNRPELLKDIFTQKDGKLMLSLVSQKNLKRILQKLFDETAFLSPFGIRSVSRTLASRPFTLNIEGEQFSLDYEPAESTVPLFGGNSNWRGPIWFPLNYLLIESLQKFHYHLGDEFKVEYPTRSGHFLSLWEISLDLSYRLIKLFLKDQNGKRPLYGTLEKFQTDPHFRDCLLFHEYFHAETGLGLGASNQTGWTGLVAKLIQQHGKYA